jgi:autotransporter-associated beta strand protein
MKRSSFRIFISHSLCIVCAIFVGASRTNANQTKANNDDNLEVGASWVSGNAPGTGDNAIWDSTVTLPANCTNTLGATETWGGIVINNPSAPVIINGTTTLTLNDGINMGNATVNFSPDISTITLASNQTWTVAAGRTLTTGSSATGGRVQNNTVTLTGGGIWTTSGTDDNGSLGIIVNAGTVNLNKTSNSGTHAVGGGGLMANSGTTVRITGSGGDQIYNSCNVTINGTFDLDGNTETISDLTGSGIIDNTATGKSAALTLSNGASAFNGTIQSSGSGSSLSLIKGGTGVAILSGANTYNGGTTVTGGTLALTGTNVTMAYTVSGGTLSVSPANSYGSLPMNNLIFGGSGSQLTFNLNGFHALTAPLISDGGNVTMSGNVPVNVQNVIQSGTYVLLQYSGTRSGSGSFVAGSLPAGATITDDTTSQQVILTYVSLLEPRVVIPTLNTNEVVVTVATPQQYGAVGDGITDDSAAFQKAMNAVYNSGGQGGGVVYVPVGDYAFYTNLVVPTGVTLHGDWTDWTKGASGLVGTTFKVYIGAGQTNGTSFITMNNASTLRDVNIWYPNQNPANIVGYPFTAALSSDCVVQNVALVNSYQGIQAVNAAQHILSTVVGTPLYLGANIDSNYDVCHAEDIRFSPDVWPASGLSNAPAVGGSYATWMRNNGTGMQIIRMDGDFCMDTYISGYNVGILFTNTGNGDPGCTFYSGAITNCATGIMAQDMPGALGLMFANFTFDDDIAVNRTRTDTDANILFERCSITGNNGAAISSTGSDWHSWMQFQDCTISNTLDLAGPGVFNVVDSTLLGSTQCVLSASATRAAFTGCTFSPVQKIVNNGTVSNLLVDVRSSVSNSFPIVYWTNIVNNYVSRQPAKTNLYVVTDAAWDAAGNGIADDTAAIQGALTAAGTNGGGIVYVPAGLYHLTNTLDVPGGVELRGAYEMRGFPQAAADGYAKGSILRPYGGQGTTNGPAAIALEANSGLVGVTISYENQNNSCIPFPPAIQGRGGNIHAIGVICPNPYYYVDLDTYACTNHFFYLVDGWALKTGFNVGNGSSGSLVDCMGNWTAWIDNGESQSTLPQSAQAPVLEFVDHQLQFYNLGDCNELMVKDFNIIENTFLHVKNENGIGPNATLIGDYCDATIQGIVLDGHGTINAVNTGMAVFNFNDDSDLADTTVGVTSTTNCEGMATFFNTIVFGGSYLDFNINGGDVVLESAHSGSGSNVGSTVNGGVLHLVNYSANPTSGNSPYNVAFGANAGLAGQTNEYIACYDYYGCTLNNLNLTNPVNARMDYSLSQYSVLDNTLPLIDSIYPNGANLFQDTNALSFTITSPAGINTSNVIVTLNGVILTNLLFSGSATAWYVSYPGLPSNTTFTLAVTLTDNNGNVTSATAGFDTFNPTNYIFEATDFDYTSNGVSGLFIDNPQTNAYFNLSSTAGIDYSNSIAGEGSSSYRPQGLETEACGDILRPAYSAGLQDYDVGFNNSGTGNWGNYTRNYPAGIYYIYERAASPDAPMTDNASLSLVTSGRGTMNQATMKLGTFSIPNTGGWQTYAWVPLLDSAGNLAKLTNSGSIETLRVRTDNGGYNVNFYELVAPATPQLTISSVSGNAAISFLTRNKQNYQVQYENNLTNASWIPLGDVIYGNGEVSSITDSNTTETSRFYRVQLQ